MLSNPLAVLGIFMMGASAGGFVTHIRYRSLLRDCRKAVEIDLANQRTPDEPTARPASKPHFGMKALILAHDEEMLIIFSHLLHEQGIDVRKCSLESEALRQLSSEKFEAIVLDFDQIADCPDLLKKLPRANENVLLIAIASGDQKEANAAVRAGVTFVVQRPLVPTEIREVLRVAYGRMLRESQRYFRLAVALPVSIRKRSGEVLQCTSLNLSQTGMAVNNPFKFMPGESVNIAFAIPNTDVFVSAEGKVIWDDKHGKTGLSFECTSPSAQSRYYEWLHDHFFMRQSDASHSNSSEQMVLVG